MAELQLRGINKSFGAVKVIHDVDLDIGNGEFVVFVGPSGCGKSTLLRTISGLEEPSSGQVLIGGEGEWEDLRQCSIVVARYGVPGMATGMLGVLGPMRMSYSRTIPTVRYVAGLLSDFVNDTIAGE